MRVAVVGAGARAIIATHIPRLSPESRVTLVADPSERGRHRAHDLFGSSVEIVNDVRSVAERRNEVDAAIVTTPDDTHASVATELLNAGIPVYLEKPMTINTVDADELLRTASRTGTKLYVGHNMRHMAVVQLMRKIIQRGEIGAVKTIWVRHFVGNGGDYYFKDWHAERRRSNTLLLQKGAHDIDVIHYLSGSRTNRVTAMGALTVYGQAAGTRDNSDKLMSDWFSMGNWPPAAQTDLHEHIDVEDLSMMTMRLDSGVLASYQQCHFTPDYWRNYTVIGDAGRLENFGDGDGGEVRVWDRRHNYAEYGDRSYRIVGDAGGHDDADVETMREFVEFVETGGATKTSPVAARDAVAAAAAAADSLRHGGVPVDVPAVDDCIAAYFENGQRADAVS